MKPYVKGKKLNKNTYSNIIRMISYLICGTKMKMEKGARLNGNDFCFGGVVVFRWGLHQTPIHLMFSKTVTQAY